MQDTEMVPYVQKPFGSPISTRSNSPSGVTVGTPPLETQSDDEISVGCPSPALNSPTRSYERHRVSFDDESTNTNDKDMEQGPQQGDDYFKPLKKLKMVVDKRISSPTRDLDPDPDASERTSSSSIEHGVKSFSIMDILNHRPSRPQNINNNSNCSNTSQHTRIVRPWDIETESEAQQSLERFHRQLKAQHQLALLRPEFASAFAAAATVAHHNQSYTSETGSDRSSSVTSDCCSPDIVPTTSSSRQRHSSGQQKGPPGSTPLDALFQMTSKTFDQNNGESSADGQNSHLNLFNNRQQPKKKRKSRTAFTNHQIFELEKRFLYQKYLSPADRDEIAASLGLSNAQVITWFQNRRAKLKRDMEELKKDVESAKLLTAHKSFLENVQDLGILKKKPMVNMIDECPKNLVMSHDNK